MKHTVLLQHCILCKYPRDNTAEHKNILKEILKTSWKTDRVYMTYTSSTKAAIQYDYQCINGIKTLSETWDSALCEMNNRQEQGCTTHLLWNWTRPLRHRTPNAAHVSWTWLLSQHLTLEEKSHHTIVHINSPNSSIFQFQYPNSALKEIQEKWKEPSENTHLPFGNCPTTVVAETSKRMLKKAKKMLKSKIIFINW